MPLGVKNRRTGERYHDTHDERPLCGADLAFMRRQFANVEIERFHVLALLAKVFGDLPRFERCDWRLFRVLPLLRRLGDNVVVVLQR